VTKKDVLNHFHNINGSNSEWYCFIGATDSRLLCEVVSIIFLEDAGHFRYIRLAFWIAALQVLGIYCYTIWEISI
jgi:hypothetical protein